MADIQPQISRPAMGERAALVVVAAFVYLAVPSIRGEAGRPSGHFAGLAEAFLGGSLSIQISPATDRRTEPSSARTPRAGLSSARIPPRLDELIPTADPDRFYCAYPPLPAVLLLPFVAAFGAALKVETACRLVSVVNVALFGACLWRLPARLGQSPPGAAARVALSLLFAFGTVCWHNAAMGGDWHLAHAVALAAMLLALREWLAGRRLWVVGCFVGLAILTRPTAALTGLFFAVPLVRARDVPQLVKLSAGPAFAVFLLAVYNNARFGSPLEFGYDRMLLRGVGGELMNHYGQFHPHFFLKNAFWFFLAPPWPGTGGRFPFIGYDPRGLSLFVATPAFFYVFAALRRGRRCACAAAAGVGIAACLVPLLLYFNTGYVQFGHRFSMDYLPLLMVWVVAGMGSRPSRMAYVSITVSIAVQGVGLLLDPVSSLPAWLTPSP